MKKYILISFFSIFFFCNKINAQTYYPLVDTNKVWSTIYIIYNPTPGDSSFFSYFTKFYSDTVVNGNTYKKIHRSNDEFQQNWETRSSLIREDSLKKVYLKYDGYDEFLIYDFSLVEGDTVYLQYGYLIVSYTDSIFINGTNRKRIVFGDQYSYECYESWIEGIGSSCGILNSGNPCMMGGKNDFLCLYENDFLIYQNPIYNNCFLITNNQNLTINDINPSIYYNYIESTIHLNQNQSGQELEINIYNLLGQKKISLNTKKSEDRFLIEKKNFPNNIYLYTISENNKIVKNGKIFINLN